MANEAPRRSFRFWGPTFFVAALFLTWLAGCGDSVGKSPAKTRQRISFLTYFSGTLGGGVQDLVKSFNSAHSEYELTMTPLDHEAFKTSIRRTLENGKPPDLYSYWAGARVVSVLPNLQPLDDIWTRGKFESLFSPMIIDSACTYSGNKYLLPITQHFVCFFYNRSVFEKYAVKPPVTWEEFLGVCETLRKGGIIPIALGSKTRWPAQFWFDFLLLRTAPLEYRQKLMRGEAHYTDTEVARALDLWKKIVLAGYFNPDATRTNWDSGADEMVFQGKAAMTLMGTWAMGYWGDDRHRWEAGKDYDYFVFPLVDPEIPPAALGPIDGFVIPKKALNATGAREVLLHLAGAESQSLMSRGSGAFSPNLHVASSTYNDLQRRMQADIRKCREWAFPYDLCVPPEVAEPALAAFNEFLEFPDLHPEIFKRLEQSASKVYLRERK